MFGVNLILAIAWIALTGEFTFINLLVGFGVGYAMMLLTSKAMPSESAMPRYVRSFIQITGFVSYVLWTIILANFRMAKAVLQSPERLNPAIVAVPLDLTSSAEITVLANWITLTPGTLTLEVSEDRSHIFVHTIQCDDVEAFRDDIKHNFERRIQEVFA